MKRIVIVVGMHRSGTSLVSGLLHKSGIFMGDENSFLPKPNPENPEGFFENYNFRRINDKILEKNGYFVKEWHTCLPELKTSFFIRRKITSILKNSHDQHSFWGWKDPRQMLTSKIWLSSLDKLHLLEMVRIVFVYRNPFSVSQSMQKRGNFENLQQGLDLWNLYNEQAINDLEQFKVPTLFFSFETLINDPKPTINKLSNFVDKDIPFSVYENFFSEKHIHSKPPLNSIDLENKKTDSLFSLLQNNHV